MSRRLLVLPVTVLTLTLAWGCSSDASDDGGEVAGDALSTSDFLSRGEAQIHFPVDGRPDEVCIVPKKGGGAYSADDLKAEKKLCNANFYNATPGEGAALCPKDSSTNPGVLVYKLEGKTKAEVEAAGCETSKIGAFKQSVTCSYSGSILGYYHLSRFLGGAANVPVAVIRTMDLEKHKEMVERGVKATVKVDGPGFDVHDAWVQYQGFDAAPAKRPLLYTADLKQIYGAFQNKVADDAKHPKMRTTGGAAGLNQFLQGETFKVLSDTKKLADRFPGGAGDAASLQGMLLAKDASDMVLMDELMQQADRYGNIHAVAYKVFEEGGVLKKVKLDRANDRDDSPPVDRTDITGVIVEELVLRDNDCGVVKDNLAAKANGGHGVVASLSHMSAHTYQNFQFFATQLNTAGSDVQKTMLNEALFTATDLKLVGNQAKVLASTLLRRCQSGELSLDADLRDHGKTIGKEACTVAEAPKLATGVEGGAVDSHGIELVERAKKK